MDDDKDWVGRVKSRGTWTRGLFMLLFAAVLWFSRILLFVMAVTQFLSVLIAGRPVARMLPFGRSLSIYMRDIGLYLSWNTDDIPWPGSPWPAGGKLGDEEYRDGEAGAHGPPPAEPDPPSDPGPGEAAPAGEAADSNGGGDESGDESDETPGEPPRPDA